jgi:hypothetical protein
MRQRFADALEEEVIAAGQFCTTALLPDSVLKS